MTLRFVVPGLFAALAGVGWFVQDVRPVVNPVIRQQNLDVHESSATASLVGQFRTSLSSWLWLRTDLYLHNGTEMRPISQSELERGVTIQDAHHEHQGDEEEKEERVVTVVPPKERDFRGIFGDVEREVASYKDMHNHSHNDPGQALPLFRLMTWLDPQFVQGWTTGANVMARDRSFLGTGKAIDFLKEGWRANPDSIDILMQIGSTFATRNRQYQAAIEWLEKARAVAMKKEALDEHEKDALEDTYRWLSLCYRESGQKQKEQVILLEACRVFPDDKILSRLLKKAQNLR